MTHFNKYLFLLSLIFSFYHGYTQNKEVVFSSELVGNDGVIGINELVKIKFTGNVDFDGISNLPFKDFKIISGPTPSIYTDKETGKRVRKESSGSLLKSYYYILMPEKLGILNIRAEQMEFKERLYEAPPIGIKVTDSVEIVDYITSGMITAQEEIQLTAEVIYNSTHKNSLNVVYKLFFPYSIGLQRFGFLKVPDYSKFKGVDAPITDYEPKKENHDGKNYRSIILKSFIVPSAKGEEFEIEPLSIELFFEVPTFELDSNGSRIYESLYFHLDSVLK